MKAYNVYSPDVIKEMVEHITCQIDGKWVPARPERYSSVINRLKLAWMILTDQIDGVEWYKQ